MRRQHAFTIILPFIASATGCVVDEQPFPGNTSGTGQSTSGSDEEIVSSTTSSATTEGDSSSGTTTDPQASTGGDGGTETGGAVCGNGIVEDGESCDDGQLNGAHDACAADCSGVGAFCGDGVEQIQEDCDDGNEVDGDGCNADCARSGRELWSWEYPGASMYRAALGPDGRVAFAGLRSHTERWVAEVSADGETNWTQTYTAATTNGSTRTSLFAYDDGWLHHTRTGGIRYLGGADGTLLNSHATLATHHVEGAPNGDLVQFVLAPAFSIWRVMGHHTSDSIFDDLEEEPDWAHTLPNTDYLRLFALDANPSFYYVSTAGSSENAPSRLRRWHFEDGEMWETQNVLIHTQDAQRSLAFAPDSGLYLSGNGSDPSYFAPRIRLYDPSSGGILMTQDLPVQQLLGCSASAKDFFCVVFDNGTFLNKYDNAGALVWQTRLSHAQVEYFVHASPDGSTFVWTNSDAGVELRKLSV